MPVASYHQGPHKVGPKQIPAPKEASLRAWWNECRKVFPGLGYYGAKAGMKTNVTLETIHFSWYGGHDIFIARRQDMHGIKK